MQVGARRLGLGVVLACLGATLFAGLLVKGPCASGDWGDGRQYLRLCYTDIVPLYGTEHLQGGRLPYLDHCPAEATQCDEYPVLTMYAMWLTASPVDTFGGFFGANVILLTIAAAVTAVALYLMAGTRATYFALAPTLLIYAYVNWDLLAVALATAGTLAFLRRKDVASGVLLGLGAAAKLYPILLVVPFVAHRFRKREPDGGIHLAWAAVGAWLAVNLPFMLAAPSQWFRFFRFNATRPVDWDSLWFVSCDRVTGRGACVRPSIVDSLSLLAFLVAVAVVWIMRRSRDRDFPRWTLGFPILVLFLLTNKVYSPQYGLWLLPWFAVGFPGLGPGRAFALFALFEASDVAVFVTRFSWFARLDQLGGLPIVAFEWAVVARAVVLLACLAAWVRQRAGEPAFEVALSAPLPAAPAAA